jgi:DNA-binding LacI/PurR family transcriptional regulator
MQDPTHPATRVTMHDVARCAGVSHATVSNVLNNKTTVGIRPETRARVLAAAQALDFRPNFLARSLKTQTPGFISLVAEKALSPRAYQQALEGARGAAARLGYHVVLCEGYQEGDGECDFIGMYQRGIISGVIFNCAPWMERHSFLDALQRHGVPHVLIGSVPPERAAAGEVNFVRLDFYREAYEATRHLAEKDLREIHYLCPEPDWLTERDRLRGYRAACKALRIRPRVHRFREFVECPTARLQPPGAARAQALVTAWDSMAYSLMPKLQQDGYQVPSELELLALDDINYTACAFPLLSTISQPNEQAGAVAMELLDQFLKTGRARQVLLHGTLAIRQSSR